MILPEVDYLKYKETSITGRYVTHKQISEFTKGLNNFILETVGYSVEKRSIQSITVGEGATKLLLWSQMHGNESTTTKAVLDLLNFLRSDTAAAAKILKKCSLKIILMLNPDGAEVYTRVNANKVDLNRDAQDLSQPESKVLRKVYNKFKPHFCFNLHDQRTIFNVGSTAKPATVSFLAPSHDKERSISKTRGISMQLIVAMNQVLQGLIPGQIGRYDDGFNANCVGDTFQMLKTPTILFEAGHFKNDYNREQTRGYIFWALLAAIDCISRNSIFDYAQDAYFNIPENQKLFYDVLIKNAKILNDAYPNSIGVLFKEELIDRTVHFKPTLENIKDNEIRYGHKTFSCADQKDLDKIKKEVFWSLLAT